MCNSRLREKIQQLPRQPGIYLMKNSQGEVIYVGKATDLRSRVRSYFQHSSERERLITQQIAEVADVEVVVAGSEKEALILENNFIKQFRPRYNVLFRDDKSFVSIKIPRDEKYPRPLITRRVDDENAIYFGPYADARAARETLRVIQDLFPLRKCTAGQFDTASRPCVYGQMDKCLAPCCRDVSEEEYRELLDEVRMFLKGRRKGLIDRLKTEMNDAADDLNYERAAVLRDRIEAIESTLEKQRVASTMDQVDRDVFGLHVTDRSVWVSVLFVRGGNMQDSASYEFEADIDTGKEVFRSFLNQFYAASRFIPREVLLPVETEDMDVLGEWLTEKKERKVKVLHPQRGRKKRLVELACRNAGQSEQVAITEEKRRTREIESLRNILALENLPHVIECFDVSTLGGREAVASMVVFRDGEADKNSYRRYRIKGVEGQNDFASMKEVIRRRYRHVADRDGESWQQIMPDLIVVDGGKGQLRAAGEALADLEVEPNDLAGLAKARRANGRQTDAERVFLPGEADPVVLPEHSYGFRLITRIRDEAHRFALNYHRKVRRERSLTGPLEDIKGIGSVLARRLMDRFRSLDNIAGAETDDIAQVKGVSPDLARRIKDGIADINSG